MGAPVGVVAPTVVVGVELVVVAPVMVVVVDPSFVVEVGGTVVDAVDEDVEVLTRGSYPGMLPPPPSIFTCNGAPPACLAISRRKGLLNA